MSYRQTGRTTREMQIAPKNAVYVWCNSRIDYPRALARAIGREDLVIRPLSWLTMQSVAGHKFSGIALDHAMPQLSDDSYRALMYARIHSIPESNRRITEDDLCQTGSNLLGTQHRS